MELEDVKWYDGSLYREITPDEASSSYGDGSLLDYFKEEVIVDIEEYGV